MSDDEKNGNNTVLFSHENFFPEHLPDKQKISMDKIAKYDAILNPATHFHAGIENSKNSGINFKKARCLKNVSVQALISFWENKL